MLASTAGQNARGASSVDGLASRTLSAARVGERAAQSFASSMLQVREDNQAVASAVQELHLQVGRIGQIVEFIQDVADRADLLAVNAELQGTRAGDVGLGFSLIAAEMRRLAESVLRTTQEIEQLIQEIRDGTLMAVQATQDCIQVTETGMQLAGEISGSFRKVLELAHRTADAIKAISLSTHLQQIGTGQLAATMGEVLQAMQETSEANRRMSVASDDLAGLARQLGEVVSRFQVESPEEHA
jgi:methyl-accepting chemotaxis protein